MSESKQGDVASVAHNDRDSGDFVEIVRRVTEALPTGQRALVAVDGVDGSGKTMFAADLARALRRSERAVVEIHVDDFHHLRERRYRRGRMSPEGFWLDSYDYAALERDVLRPLSADGLAMYRTAATDLVRDVPINERPLPAPEACITTVEGIFLHRDELTDWWDYSIFLDVPFHESVRRMMDRDKLSVDAQHALINRYVAGQRLYFAAAAPQQRASLVVDNSILGAPRIVTDRHR